MKSITEFKLSCFTLLIFGVNLKFFKLGKISQTILNKKSNNFLFRKVTLTPKGAPFLIFKKIEDFFDLKKNERWPVINSKNAEMRIKDFREISLFIV